MKRHNISEATAVKEQSMTTTKTTSLQKMTEALTEAGWEFTVTETEVKVPDYDNANRTPWSSRASYVPTKVVPGVKIEASNGIGKNFTVEFEASGKFLAPNTKGSYPFTAKQPLKVLLKEAEKHGPIATAQRVERMAQERAERESKEEREVAEAYAAATQTLAEAESLLRSSLEITGLSPVQVEVVMGLLEAAEKGPEESTVAAYFQAKTSVERTGKGWLPGKTSVSGIYADGKKVRP